MLSYLKSIGIVLLATLVAGCGSSPDSNRLETKPVMGVVKFKGQPVSGATVTFLAKNKTPGSTGQTDAEGRFVMTTYEHGDGVVPGEYDVTIVKFETPPAESAVSVEDPNYQPPAEVAPEKVKPPKNLLPPIYAQPQTSKLQVSVGAEGANDLLFDLQ